MIVRLTNSPDAARLVTPTMLVLWLVLATVPLWIARIGLYPYLGIEILIWSLYALAFNLVLGTAGLALVRTWRLFRHRRLCVRALPVRHCRQSLDLSRGRGRGRGACRRAGGAVHLAPARHLLCLHDHRLRPDLLDARDQVAPRSPAARTACSRSSGCRPISAWCRSISPTMSRSIISCSRCSRSVVLALWRLVHSPYGRVVAAIRQSETRAAHLGYDVWLYKASVFASVGGRLGPCRRPVRDGAARRLP